ncbi:MAG: phosphatidate cytidylyltransferase [Spirochaetales bacterium]|nr:phosphatidate cytidylyltransferase [Spirochaetales bacterium]
MSSLSKRLISFVIAVSAVILFVAGIPYLNHLGLTILILLVTFGGTNEVSQFLAKKGYPVSRVLPYLTPLLPLTTWLQYRGLIPGWSFEILLILLPSFLLGKEIFIQDEKVFGEILPRVSSSLFALIYPGLFSIYLVRIAFLPNATLLYLLFLLLVSGNDTMAYITGMTFGRKARKPLKISPKKSTVGFIGGILGTFGFSAAFFFFAPQVFGGSIIRALLLAAVVAPATISGDLIASALKRSTGVKDSGILIPGRGGILDSIDSIIFTAPFFFYFMFFLQL